MTNMLSFLHLAVFEAILRLKSVSLAADSLDLSQPSISRYLTALRAHFGNPLFVRTRTGMEPTSVAIAAAQPIGEALSIYRSRLSGGLAFDKANSQRQFRIAASDIGHLLMLPPLDRVARRDAPGVRFVAVPLGRATLGTQLENAEVDLAFGSFPQLMAGIREQTLYREQYLCAVPRGWNVSKRLSMARFKASAHVLVVGHPLGHVHEDTERRIRALVPAAQIRIETQSFLLAAALVEQQDIILTVPARVARLMGPGRVATVTPPLELSAFEVKQYWHERFDDDPGNRWLRATIAAEWRRRGQSATYSEAE